MEAERSGLLVELLVEGAGRPAAEAVEHDLGHRRSEGAAPHDHLRPSKTEEAIARAAVPEPGAVRVFGNPAERTAEVDVDLTRDAAAHRSFASARRAEKTDPGCLGCIRETVSHAHDWTVSVPCEVHQHPNLDEVGALEHRLLLLVTEELRAGLAEQ